MVGAGGRMGQEVCRAVAGATDMELVAAVDPAHEGAEACGRTIVGEVNALGDLGTEVVVDFTVAAAARHNLVHYAQRGIHAVVGTTGLSEADLATAAREFEAEGANAVVAPNFAIGAVLLMHFCRLAAPHMDGVEVIELHHDAKRDAPSGTALHTAEGIAAARAAAGSGPFAADPTTEVVLEAARGAEGPGGVRVHSVRLPGLVAHEEVIFGASGQSLSIRHDSYDRRSFMPGVLLAVRAVPRRRRPDRRARAAARAVNPEVRERLLQATYDCVARWGINKTTVEDAASEAGVSRATVYRYFPGGRDELMSAVVGWEFARFFRRLYEEVHDAETLEEVMERGLLFARRAVRRPRSAPADPGDRTRGALPPPDRRVDAGPHPDRRLPHAVPGASRDGARTRPRTRRRSSSRAWCSPTSPRPAGGTSRTPARWRSWCARSSWPASGDGRAVRGGRPPEPAPPVPACARHPDRRAAVRCARCDRPICTECMVHAPVGWQCPDCTATGARRSRRVPAFTHTGPNRTGVVGSTNPTPVVLSIVAVNVVVFLLERFGDNTSFIDRYAMHPDLVHRQGQYYRAVTAMFLHANFLHILFNMIALLIVGPAVEVLLGKARFLALYLIAGLGGSVASYLLGPHLDYGLGASGAIMGVMGAYVVVGLRRHLPVAPVVGAPGVELRHRLQRRHRLAGPPGRLRHRLPARPALRLRRRPARPRPGAGADRRGECGRRRVAGPAHHVRLTGPCQLGVNDVVVGRARDGVIRATVGIDGRRRWPAAVAGRDGRPRWLTVRQKSPYCFISGCFRDNRRAGQAGREGSGRPPSGRR